MDRCASIVYSSVFQYVCHSMIECFVVVKARPLKGLVIEALEGRVRPPRTWGALNISSAYIICIVQVTTYKIQFATLSIHDFAFVCICILLEERFVKKPPSDSKRLEVGGVGLCLRRRSGGPLSFISEPRMPPKFRPRLLTSLYSSFARPTYFSV